MGEVHMTREECESKIAELILEIQKVHKQYNPYADYMTICLHPRKGYIFVNNEYWESDKKYPIEFHMEVQP